MDTTSPRRFLKAARLLNIATRARATFPRKAARSLKRTVDFENRRQNTPFKTVLNWIQHFKLETRFKILNGDERDMPARRPRVGEDNTSY